MLRKIVLVNVLLLILVIGIAGSSYADRRQYAYSYGYMTAYQSEKEIEIYTDYQTKGDTFSLKNQLELEYGITSHWMASIYGVFTSSNTQDYRFTQGKLETRYRFGEAGDFLMDPTLYLELKMPVLGEQVVEFKQILAKDFDDYNLTINLVLEKALSAANWDQAYTMGFSKLITNAFRGGIEAKGSIDGANSKIYLGPSFAAVLNGFKINMVVGFGMTTASNNLYIRNIISYEI